MSNKIETDALTGTETTGHEWDGLRELNTPLPRWWLYVFYCTIVFALGYVLVYPALPLPGATGVSGWTARGALGPAVEAEAARRAPIMGRLAAASPEEIVANPELRGFALAGGRAVFANNCAQCHGAGGQGAQGGFPSLADDDWLWGGTLADIRTTIQHGIRNADDEDARTSQMPRFLVDGVLTAAQVEDVAEHVLSLSGAAHDAAAAGRGAALYAENCVACHGAGGEGNRALGAPRLSDQVWLYGGDKAAIRRSIGYARGGVMPAWTGRLDGATINMLAVYVHALGGGE